MLKGSLPEVFLDTDVAFDIISKRDPYNADSVKLLELTAKGDFAYFCYQRLYRIVKDTEI